MYVWVFWVYVCICTTCMPGAHGGRRGHPTHGTGVNGVMDDCVKPPRVCWELNTGIYRSNKCLKLLSRFSSTSTTPFNRNKKSSQPENHEWTSSLWRELFVFVCILTAVQCPPPADLLWKWNLVLSKTDRCTVFGSFLQEVDALWQKSIHFFA